MVAIHTIIKCKFNLQEFSPADDINHTHNIEERAIYAPHNEYEILAQAICTSIAIKRGVSGWIYAVRRYCTWRHHHNCETLCNDPLTSRADIETRRQWWKAIAGIHVYTHRPPSTEQRPYLGLKVLWIDTYDQNTRCGPNFCCCFAHM